MVDGTYEVQIHSPLGRKPGKVAIRTVGEKVVGDIDVPVIGKQQVEGTLTGEDAFVAQGKFKMMLVGKVEYSLRGEVDGETLHISIKSNKGDLDLEGTRL